MLEIAFTYASTNASLVWFFLSYSDDMEKMSAYLKRKNIVKPFADP